METDGTACCKVITSTWNCKQALCLIYRQRDGQNTFKLVELHLCSLKKKTKIVRLKCIFLCCRKNLHKQAMWPAPDGWEHPGQLLQSRFWWVLLFNPIVKNVFKTKQGCFFSNLMFDMSKVYLILSFMHKPYLHQLSFSSFSV